MNSRLTDIYCKYRNRSKDDLAELARQAFVRMVNRFYNALGDRDRAYASALSVYAKFAAADGQLSGYEAAIIKYIHQEDCSDEDIMQMVVKYKDVYSKEKLRDFCKLNVDFLNDLLEFAFSIIAIDGKISIAEEDLLDYITA